MENKKLYDLMPAMIRALRDIANDLDECLAEENDDVDGDEGFNNPRNGRVEKGRRFVGPSPDEDAVKRIIKVVKLG